MTPKEFQQLLGVYPDGKRGPKTLIAIDKWFESGLGIEGYAKSPEIGVNKTSERGLNDLIQSEGFKTRAYQDSVGVWTIGIGHTAAAGYPIPKAGMVITSEQVKEIFARDIVKYETAVFEMLPNVPQHVFDGAVSFHFNTGGIKRAKWVQHYLSGDMKLAYIAFMSWKKPPSIISRRTREAELIFEGKYAS